MFRHLKAPCWSTATLLESLVVSCDITACYGLAGSVAYPLTDEYYRAPYPLMQATENGYGRACLAFRFHGNSSSSRGCEQFEI